ncbi:MAG: nucleotidyltransferase domain-containing protein [Methanosarcinales archaeon]
MKNKIKDSKIKYIISNYLPKIKSLYSPKEIWFWGSRIYGNPNQYSDIDMIIVSDKFAEIRFIKRRSTFLKQTGYFMLFYQRIREKKKKSLGIVSEALSKGIRIL